jgi:hypothetical protein
VTEFLLLFCVFGNERKTYNITPTQRDFFFIILMTNKGNQKSKFNLVKMVSDVVGFGGDNSLAFAKINSHKNGT